MNRIKWILPLFFPILLFTACQSSKSIQNKMLNIHSELYYELTTPVYFEDINTAIYLKSIDYSEILPYTTVKGKGGMVIPLLIFNYAQSKYEVSLGEKSLIQPYNEFLTDALSVQCNRSSCFNLMVCDSNTILPDSALVLEVKINRNVTSARMISNEGLFFFPVGEEISIGFSNWGIDPPVCWLDISARLMQQGKYLWEKNYIATQDLSIKRLEIEKSLKAYEICIDNMAECLSFTTKDIVENISRDLHLLMLQRQP